MCFRSENLELKGVFTLVDQTASLSSGTLSPRSPAQAWGLALHVHISGSQTWISRSTQLTSKKCHSTESVNFYFVKSTFKKK